MEFVFTFVSILLIYVDYKLYKTLFTPFSIITTIYTVLLLVNNFFAVKMGFFEISIESMCYIMYFLILIFFISLYHLFLMRKKSTLKKGKTSYSNSIVDRNKRVIVSLFLIGLIAKYFALLQAISRYGLNNIKGKEAGVFAHIGILAIVLSPYMMIFYISNKKKVQYLVSLLLLFFNLFIFGGKYSIIIAFLHQIMAYVTIENVNLRKTFRIGIRVAFFSILMFVTTYAVKPAIIQGSFDKNKILDDIFFSLRHFMTYLVGPLVATNFYFNNAIETTVGIRVLFTVPINIVRALFRIKGYVNPINTYFVSVSTYSIVNVGGLFAECVYNSGILIASIYVAVFFCVVYYFYNKSRYNGEKLNLVSLLLAVVTVMFFSNFLTVSGVVLQVLYLWIIELFLKKRVVFRR